MVACGGDETEVVQGAGGGPASCPSGHVEAPGEGCMPVGIQGCVEMFLDEDGLCRPTADKCPPGTIPKFSEGCITVGIPNCAPHFVEADGHCYPSPDKCPAGTFPVPTEGCVPIDGEEGCGCGIWGNIADSAGTVWIDPAYAGGDGDGSQLKPITTIGEALVLVRPGGRIALAEGNYTEALALVFAIEIVGRCPSLVQLSGAAPTPYGISAAVFVDGAQGVVLRRLRIGGVGDGVLAAGGSVELHGVHVREATGAGVLSFDSASVMLDHTLIERTAATASGTFGRGIDVEGGAELVLSRSALVENRELALFAQDATTSVTVSDSLLARTLPQASDLADGRGAEARMGATLEFQSSALLENRDAAIFAADLATSVTVTTSVIARTLPRANEPAGGRGAQIQDGARLLLQSSALVENREVALTAASAGTSVSVSESLIARTLPDEKLLTLGRGAVVQQGASLALQSSTLIENREVALYAADPGTSIDVSESLIARTLPRESDRGAGHGVEVQLGATLALQATALVENSDVALVAARDDTHVTVSESFIGPTQPRQSDANYGVGAGCARRAHLELLASVVQDSATAAVLFGMECTGRISGTLLGRVAEGRFQLTTCPEGIPSPCPDMEIVVATYEGIADGLVAAFGSTVDVERTRFSEASRAAIIYHESAGSLRSVHAKGRRFGLVLQGEPRPDWQDASNLFEGAEQSIVSQGNLPVPEAPPIPEP